MSDIRTQVRLRPIIRVFVSSTFSDMKHERNALAAEAYPRLEELCQKNGFQFQAIDLRWGVSTEAGLDHRTMRICFDELRRAQEISPKPNFLILLGNRYGWRPLPEEATVKEFHTLEQAAAQMPDSADKSAVAVLREWYREDTNAVPPVYLLQTRRQGLGDDQDYTDNAVWTHVQAVLWTIINRAMPPEQLQWRFDGAATEGSPPAIVRFQASATEQETWHGALRVPDAREHVLAFFREIENLAAFSEPKQITDFADVDPSGSIEVALQTEQDRLKAELRQRLGSANVFRNEVPARLVEAQDNQGCRTADVTTDHLAQLCADVVNRLSEIIQGQIDEYWRKTAKASTDRTARELEIEQREYERFAQERGSEESFVGRQVELQAILDYVGSDSRWPLVIHGASGCGKTALLARASQEVAKTRKRVERFIGVAPRSSDLRSLLSSLCQELRQQNPRTDALPTEIKELRDEFSQHLQAATTEQPLILFLDALDQLADADNGRLLHWLPLGELQAHVKLVVSCLSDRGTADPAGQPYAELKRRQISAENFINLDVLSEADARLLLFDRWLPKAGRKVSDGQRARIEQCLASPTCRQPIFLKLLFEEVQLWHSYDRAPLPGESVEALLGQLFDRLSQPTNHGPLLMNRVLGYLSASRHGLAENEILEILFADPEYRAKLNEATEQTRHELPPNAKRIPIALWSRLRFDLAPYLTERAAPGANVLTFYHRQVAEWARRPLVDKADWYPHRRLADYFELQAPPRKLDEFPWQLQQSQSWSRLYAALSDVEIISQMWQRNYFEIEEFWAKLKKESGYQIWEAYIPVIQSPEKYCDSLPVVVRLLRDSVSTRREARDTLSLCQAMERHGRTTGNHELLYRSLAEQGVLHCWLGEQHDALRVYQELDRVSEMEGNLGWRCVAIGGQASTHWEMDDADKAMRLHKEEERLARAIRNELRLQASLGNQATILASVSQHNEALSLREEQARLCHQLGQFDGLASALLGIASTLLVQDPTFSHPDTSKRVFDTLQEMDSIGIRYGMTGVSYHAKLLQYKTYSELILQLIRRNECREAIRLSRQQSEVLDKLRAEFDDQEINALPNGLLTQHLLGLVEKLVREQPNIPFAIELLTEAEWIAKKLGKLKSLSLIARQRNWVLAMIRYNEAEAQYQSLPIESQRRTKRPEEPKVELDDLGW